ncbi:MAG: hypothetical protein VX335_05430, partial [Pseudomonadota bacterium]|nr:hypothetical protein [Pseudomonadota bacterium]
YNMHFASINITEENDLLRKIINNYSKNPKKYSEYINVLIQLILSRIIILLNERGSKRAQSLANISGSGKNDLINTIFKNLDQEQPCVITTICNWSQDQLNIDISRDDIQEIYDKVNLIWNVITAGEFNGNHLSSGAPHLDEFIFKGSSKGNFEVVNGKLSVEAARLFYLSGYSHTRNMSGYQDLINVTVYDFKDNSDFFQVLRLQEPTTPQDKLTALLQDYLDSNKDSEIDLDIISNILPVMDNNNKNIFSERVKDLVLIRYKMDSGCKNSIRNIVPHLNIDHQKNITSQYPELHKNSIFLNPCFLSASISISCFLGMLFSSMYSSTAANLISKIVSLKMATVSGLPILHILIISILLFSLLTLTLKFISKRPPTEIKHMTDIRPEAGTKLMSEYGGININTTEVNAHNRYDSKKKAANIGLERLTSYS